VNLEKINDIETEEQEIEDYPYITVDGIEPIEPTGFFQTKKFWVSGVVAAVIMGVGYLVINLH
jgi:hypothetical protein